MVVKKIVEICYALRIDFSDIVHQVDSGRVRTLNHLASEIQCTVRPFLSLSGQYLSSDDTQMGVNSLLKYQQCT